MKYGSLEWAQDLLNSTKAELEKINAADEKGKAAAEGLGLTSYYTGLAKALEDEIAKGSYVSEKEMPAKDISDDEDIEEVQETVATDTDGDYQDFLKWVDFSPMNHPESWAINDDEAFSKMTDKEFYDPENIKNVHATFGIGPVVGKKGPLQPLSLDEIDTYYKSNPSAKDEAYKWYLEAKQDGWKATDTDGDGDIDRIETTKISPNILDGIKDFGN